jgi:hypothetical protein
MNQSRDPVHAIPWASRALVRHPRIPGFESVSVPSRSNIADLRIIISSVSLMVLQRLGHISAGCPENEIDGGTSQSLELGVVFMLTDSCQPTVKDVSHQ